MFAPSNLYNTALDNFRIGDLKSAAHFCEQILVQHAEDVKALHLLGAINLKRGNISIAAEQFNKLISLNRNDAIAHLQLGRAQYIVGNIDHAAKEYEQAVKCRCDSADAKNLLQSTRAEIKELDKLVRSLDKNNKAPSIKFSLEEVEKGFPDLITLNKAVRLYKHFGYLVIEDLFTESFINALYRDFKNDYKKYFEDDSFDNALKVGDKRIMISLKLQGLFNNTDYYANPLVVSILSRLLGGDFILFGLGAVVSLPGSDRQHTHKDHRALFEDSAQDGSLPSFAITMGVPLIDMNEKTGTTRMYGKTHRRSGQELLEKERKSGINPVLRRGSCMLFDYRVLHEGTPNNSSDVRPLMYNVYSRAWFRDCQNYKKQKSILVTDDEYQKIPETHRHLFSWMYTT